MRFTVKCIIHPTEDIQKVQNAIKAIFGDIKLDLIEENHFSKIYSTEINQTRLSNLRQTIHDKRIIDAVRVRLLRNRDEHTSVIYLDKQAAFMGKLRLIDNTHENPLLGSIELKIDYTMDSEFEKFVDWFSPPTKDGKVLT